MIFIWHSGVIAINYQISVITTVNMFFKERFQADLCLSMVSSEKFTLVESFNALQKIQKWRSILERNCKACFSLSKLLGWIEPFDR